MLHHVATTRLTPALAAAQRILGLAHDGTLFELHTEANQSAVVEAFDTLEATLGEAARELAEATSAESPFLRDRPAILRRAELCQLVLFLFGHGQMSFFHLFSSTTPAETAIALRCIAHYADHGENDPHFMRLAAEIFDMQKAAA